MQFIEKLQWYFLYVFSKYHTNLNIYLIFNIFKSDGEKVKYCLAVNSRKLRIIRYSI